MVCFALCLLQVATREGEPGSGVGGSWGGGGVCSGELRVAGAARLSQSMPRELERERRRVPAAAARLPTQPRRGPRKTAASSGARAGAQGRLPRAAGVTRGPGGRRRRRRAHARPGRSWLFVCLLGELEGVCESNPGAVRRKTSLKSRYPGAAECAHCLGTAQEMQQLKCT